MESVIEEYDCAFAGTPFVCYNHLKREIAQGRALLFFSPCGLIYMGIVTGRGALSAGPFLLFLLSAGAAVGFALAGAAYTLFAIPALYLMAPMTDGQVRAFQYAAFVLWPLAIMWNWPLWAQGILTCTAALFVLRRIWLVWARRRAQSALCADAELFARMWRGLFVWAAGGNGGDMYAFDNVAEQREAQAKQRLEVLARRMGYAAGRELLMANANACQQSIQAKPPTAQNELLARLYGWPDFESMYASYPRQSGKQPC